MLFKVHNYRKLAPFLLIFFSLEAQFLCFSVTEEGYYSNRHFIHEKKKHLTLNKYSIFLRHFLIKIFVIDLLCQIKHLFSSVIVLC